MKKIISISMVLLFSFFINCGKGLEALFDNKAPPGIDDTVIEFPDKNNIVYVSPAGKDDNLGTRLSPLQTIQAGIQLAQTKSFETVYVSGGLFNLENNFITPSNGIELYGGFSTNFKTRNDETIVQNSSSSGGLSDNPNKTIYFNSTIDNSTILDGFTILAGGGDYSAGIFIDGGSPIIQNCKIIGGSGDIESIGISLISSNNVVIEKNYINAGTGDESYGIALLFNSSANVNNNCILGGDGGTITTAIYINNSDANILYNTIDGGSATEKSNAISIYNLTPSQIVIIENNIIFATAGMDRLGIVENDKNSDPASIRNNDIFNCPEGLYVNYTNTNTIYLVHIIDINSLIDTVSYGNISEDPFFKNLTLGDWHFSDLSPQLVKEGGLNGIDEAYEIDTKDKDGKERPEIGKTWAIGAYE